MTDKDTDIESMEYKLWKIQQLEAMGKRLDEMIKALDEVQISIGSALDAERCPLCGSYSLRPTGETALRCGNCDFTLEIPEGML